MAIGAIALHWSYLDAEVTHLIFLLRRTLDEQGKGEPGTRVPLGHKERLVALRRLLVRVVGQKCDYLKDFDKLRSAVEQATELRHDIAHHTLTVSNPTGQDDDLCVMFLRRSKPDVEAGTILSHYVRDIFQAADLLWSKQWDLTAIVVGAINSKYEER